MVVGKTDKVLIVGAGCFGISTAYHLLERGYKDVTVIDRSDILPAPDAASTDLNKVVRSSYPEIFYARLAQEAIQAWKATRWKDTYHECGVLVLGSMSDESKNAYTNKAYENDVALGCRTEFYENGEALRSTFPKDVSLASFEDSFGYLNRDGGWAFSAQGVQIMIDNVTANGGKVIPGKGVAQLVRKNGRTTGVKCVDGTIYDADLVILATGSWTTSSFPDLDFGGKCIATGQSVVTIQLTPQEAEIYHTCPVILDFSTEFYIFPPNKDNIVKLAIHDSGYTHFPGAGQADISTPRTITSHQSDGLRIPKQKVQELREHLRRFYPELADKPFASTRLCWYTDQPDENWVIGYYPSDPSLVTATGGSGHAFKFLPVIGGVVADAIEGKLDPALVEKFAVERECAQSGIGRIGSMSAMRVLDIANLCLPEDLLPHALS